MVVPRDSDLGERADNAPLLRVRVEWDEDSAVPTNEQCEGDQNAQFHVLDEQVGLEYSRVSL